MKIAIFVGGLSNGGAERCTCGLANYLSDEGHQITIVTMSDDAPSYYLSQNVNRLILLNQSERRSFLMNTFRRLWRMVCFVRQQKQDCLISMGSDLGGILFPVFKFISNTPVIVSERSNPKYILRGIKGFIVKRLAHFIDCHICLTPEIIEWYKPYVNGKKLELIPNAVESCEKAGDNMAERNKNIVSVGRLDAGKNYPMQINAFAQICNNYPDYRLIIYGVGPEENNLKQLISELNLADRVELAGFCKDIQNEIAKARLFLFTSNYEGMPNALIEAMAAGLPCISVDCDGGAARFLIKDGENGILINKNDTEALVVQIQRLLNDDVLSQELADKAKKIIDRLSPQRVYPMWESVIKELANAKA